MAIGAIACGAVYVVLSPQPTIKRTASAPPSRLLPYERQMTTPQPTSADGSASQQKEISPVEPLPVETAPVETQVECDPGEGPVRQLLPGREVAPLSHSLVSTSATYPAAPFSWAINDGERPRCSRRWFSSRRGWVRR
jgi:hypothetical protein